VLGLFADLRAGTPTLWHEWEAVGFSAHVTSESVDWQYELLGHVLDTWLSTDRVTRVKSVMPMPELRRRLLRDADLRSEESVPKGHVILTATDLRGALALQLAAALTSVAGVYRCGRCKEPYIPLERRPWRNGKRRGLCAACKSRCGKAARERERYAQQNPTRQRNSKYRPAVP
jgi:hypothetical protein